MPHRVTVLRVLLPLITGSYCSVAVLGSGHTIYRRFWHVLCRSA